MDFSKESALPNANLIQEDIAYNGYVTVKKRMFDQGGECYSREVISRGNSVAIWLCDMERGVHLLIRQYRPTGKAGAVLMTECVAGMVEGDELSEMNEETSAVREIKEEVGLDIKAHELIRIGTYSLSPGVLSEKTTLFIANVDLSMSEHLSQHGCVDENEWIETILVKSDQLDELLSTQVGLSVTCALLFQHVKSRFLTGLS